MIPPSAALGAEGAALWRRVAALVARGPDAPLDPAERDALGLDLVRWQRQRCPAIDRVIRAFADDLEAEALDRVPGVPTDAFKSARIACFAPEHTVRTFLTSGTTAEVRGRHELCDTALYRASALATGRRWLLPDPPYRFVLLAESEAEAPHSSLGFMLARFAEALGLPDDEPPWLVSGGALDVARARRALDRATAAGERVALLGASFGFVHLLDALGPDRFALPPGSVAMPTGGFKGRSREVAPEALFAAIGEAVGLPRAAVVQEYGMTELCSQCWEADAPGRYVAPPWVAVSAVDPATLAPRPAGEQGILRIVDLSNVGSAAVVQTADLGCVHADGSFEVHGRSPGATPRGCARALDALLT
ncbi:MAG: acyl-protein synthetase [Myxococcota bacterium]